MAGKRYLTKKKLDRLKWSRNANAAKARLRLDGPPPDREPRMERAPLPWEITVRNVVDGSTGSFVPRSGRHAKRVLDLLFASYVPERRLVHGEEKAEGKRLKAEVGSEDSGVDSGWHTGGND